MSKKIVITGAGWIKPKLQDKNKLLIAKDQIPKTSEFNQWRRIDRFCKIGILAAQFALESAKGINYEKDNIAIVIGTSWGPVNSIKQYGTTIVEQGCSMASPNLFPLTVNNSMGGYLAIYMGFRGPNVTLTTGKAASADAIGYGYRLIKKGEAECVLIGGIEEYSEAREAAIGNKADNPIGEGAGFLVLEEINNAVSRGAIIKGEISEYFSLSGNGSEQRAIERLLHSGINKDMNNIYLSDLHFLRNEIGDLEGANAVFDIIDAVENKRLCCGNNSFLYSDCGRTSVLVLKSL